MSIPMTIEYNGTVTQMPTSYKSYQVTYNTQVKSANRDDFGSLRRQPLPSKWSAAFVWQFARVEDHYNWFSFLMSLDRVNFNLTIPLPNGTISTFEAYISPISSVMINQSQGNAGWWRDVTVTFVEV